MPPTFTGKYAPIRRDIYNGLAKEKFIPGGNNSFNGKEYKTEAGFNKAKAVYFQKMMAYLDSIEATPLPEHIYCNIEWHGYSPVAELRFNGGGYVMSSMIGGWGYDKESTAFADAASKSPQMMRILCDARVRRNPPTKSYGISLNKGKPYLPRFNGGVGQSSINSSMEDLGYTAKNVGWGKNYNAYEYTLKRRR